MSRCLPSIFAAALLAACATVPETGRSQLSLVPRSMEDSIGEEAWTRTLAEAPVVESGPEAELVRRVGERVAAAAARLYPDSVEGIEWEFVLIGETDKVNAWALPGGKSAVYAGLLPVTQDEDSLAIVMGHEVGHVLARHGGERMSHTLVLQATLVAAQLATGKMSAEAQDMTMQALTGVGELGFILPFSREHESEADHIGLMIAAEAGYDPRAAIDLWRRMGAGAGERPPEFLSTHPSEETRIERLTELMPEALERYGRSRSG